jgi:hypothetical protein
VVEVSEEPRWTRKGRTLQLKGRYNCRFLINWIKFKFVNCELGKMDKLLMYFMISIVGLKRYVMPIVSGSQSKSNTHEETANVTPNQISLSIRF